MVGQSDLAFFSSLIPLKAELTSRGCLQEENRYLRLIDQIFNGVIKLNGLIYLFGIFNLFWLSEAQGNLFFQTMHGCTFSDKKFEIAVNIRLGQSIDLMTPLHLICQARLYLKEIMY